MTVSVMRTRPDRREPRFYRSTQDPNLPDLADDFTDEGSGPEGAPTPQAPSLLSSATAAAGPAARRARSGMRAWLSRSGARVRQFTLSAAGLGAFAVGAFEAHTVAGWAVVGLSLLLLEHQAKT